MFRLERYNYSPEYTEGRLYVNGRFICWTLEEPWLNNARSISCIHSGEYELFGREEGSRGWRLELRTVPNRTHIQIHSGNDLDDTEGCILVGITRSPGRVWNSKKAMRAIEHTWHAEHTPGASITVLQAPDPTI